MVFISIKKIGIAFILLIVCIFVTTYSLKNEDIRISSKTMSHLVYADVQTFDDVEVNVVFMLPDVKDNTTNTSFNELETTVQMALSQASNLYIEEQEQKLEKEKQARLEEEMGKLAILSYNPFQKSNLTIKQYNNILKGTGLEGCGESYYNMEQTYNVNGLFAIGVAFNESGMGRHKANTNNFYGMRSKTGWMAFSSPDANIQYFGKLMNKSLYYGKSILDIGKVYCPGTYSDWASAVKSLMASSFKKR